MRRIPKLGCIVDATKPAWRFDAIEIRSLDSEAWTSRSRRGGLMRSKFEAWIPILDFVEVDAMKPALRSTINQLLLHMQMRSDARNSQAPKFEAFDRMRT